MLVCSLVKEFLKSSQFKAKLRSVWSNRTIVYHFFLDIVHANRKYTGRSDVTIRSPFCGYNTTYCDESNGEDLSCYSNKIESVSLRKCPYDH